MKMLVLLMGIWILALTDIAGQVEARNNTNVNKEVFEETMFTIQKNAVYNEDLLGFAYERLIPLSNKNALILKGGFIIWDPVIPVVESAFMTGGKKNFLELGVGALIADTNTDEEGGFDFVTFRLGYRYQAPKGFLLKASVIHSPDNFILPLISLGYSFGLN
ncbi:hypothetical protein [Plebeiibacterium sediminum]|uniref:Uncharacterized protein n=1 Tax=Plebeiibacterium sediminum TaxID=2992112 RepID=A0AAE3M159_9BACT|nr:hypothetical protein [Plebeiobacterium sediminum]MCW3785354.1 hypothetical protein [Plebeiobacterium sediminum]